MRFIDKLQNIFVLYPSDYKARRTGLRIVSSKTRFLTITSYIFVRGKNTEQIDVLKISRKHSFYSDPIFYVVFRMLAVRCACLCHKNEWNQSAAPLFAVQITGLSTRVTMLRGDANTWNFN